MKRILFLMFCVVSGAMASSCEGKRDEDKTTGTYDARVADVPEGSKERKFITGARHRYDAGVADSSQYVTFEKSIPKCRELTRDEVMGGENWMHYELKRAEEMGKKWMHYYLADPERRKCEEERLERLRVSTAEWQAARLRAGGGAGAQTNPAPANANTSSAEHEGAN